MQIDRLPRADAEDGKRGKKRKPTTQVIDLALEQKKSKVSAALTRVSDRYGNSERFEMEQAYRDAMDKERATGRIVSFGRKSIVFPQGAIVRSVKQHPKAYEQRNESVPEFKRVVPLGGKNCFDIMPGEVCIQLFKWRVPNPKTKQGDTSIVATSTVNGLGPREKAQFAGISTTANKVSGPDGDNRSNNLMAGLAMVIHTGHQIIPAFSRVFFSLTPFSVRGDTPSSMVPAIDEKGQPEDKFRVALHPTDERVVSAILLRRRAQVDKCVAEFDDGTATAARMKSEFWTSLNQLVTDELAGFELFPDDKPTAAYMYWYGVQRAMIYAIGQGWGFAETGLAAAIKEGREKFRISREDEDFVASHGGTVDTSQEGTIRSVLEDGAVSSFDAYFKHGIDKLISAKIDHAVQGQHNMMRRNTVGIAQNWCNPGGELDLLVGMGGKSLCCVACLIWRDTGY